MYDRIQMWFLRFRNKQATVTVEYVNFNYIVLEMHLIIQLEMAVVIHNK